MSHYRSINLTGYSCSFCSFSHSFQRWQFYIRYTYQIITVFINSKIYQFFRYFHHLTSNQENKLEKIAQLPEIRYIWFNIPTQIFQLHHKTPNS